MNDEHWGWLYNILKCDVNENGLSNWQYYICLHSMNEPNARVEE